MRVYGNPGARRRAVENLEHSRDANAAGVFVAAKAAPAAVLEIRTLISRVRRAAANDAAVVLKKSAQRDLGLPGRLHTRAGRQRPTEFRRHVFVEPDEVGLNETQKTECAHR